ncbi:MAG: TatD family hydrolase [Propionivibrio sp.]|uniref:TatD family hydrolase n=1 Tax=Candidatus Propionivibrio dominans TaxID=2954373 RepID=A0A9D7FBZ7_9RHOO|nr:TatD family hydrolase [Candidatus Propionivibrio dominans]
MLIDSHCHLDAREFDADRDAVIVAAHAAGVSGIVIPSVEKNNFSAVRDCCRRYPGCFPAYGIHPLYLDRASEDDFSTLREWLRKESIGAFPPLALGEIGLDYFVPGFDAARQEHFFIEQLKIAREFDLPVLLHVRRSLDQVLKCLRRIGVRGGIAHAFNGSHQQADEFIRLGFRLGFGGAMTYPGSTRIRKLASTLPINAIVLETDAPDMAPCWLAGERNTPAEVARIARTFSELRGLSLAEALAATSANVLEILNLPLPGLMDQDSPGMAV